MMLDAEVTKMGWAEDGGRRHRWCRGGRAEAKADRVSYAPLQSPAFTSRTSSAKTTVRDSWETVLAVSPSKSVTTSTRAESSGAVEAGAVSGQRDWCTAREVAGAA